MLAKLADLSFIIPFRLDLSERLRNLVLVCAHLSDRFGSPIIVAEYDQQRRLQLDLLPHALRRRVRHLFLESPPAFQRTRSVNLAARHVDTPLMAICDCDVLLPTRQYLDGAQLLRDGACAMCLPFENRVMWIPRDEVPRLDGSTGDSVLEGLAYPVSEDDHIFLGLISMLRTETFFTAGQMNENFLSWGYEEMEFYIRLLKLGYGVMRSSGRAYHLGHGNGGDTGPAHAFFEDNRREYHRVLALNPADLRNYIDTWPWVQKSRAKPVSRSVQ